MNPVIAPLLIPLVTACIALLIGRRAWLKRVLHLSAAAAQMLFAGYAIYKTIASGTMVLIPGGWMATTGIALVIDPLAAIMLALSAIMLTASLVFSFLETDSVTEHPLRAVLMQFLASGINLAFITGDMFNLFVAFEVMLLASYAILTLESTDRDVKHAFPYLFINLFSSTVFLCAAGLTYALFGTLNMAEIARQAETVVDPSLVSLVAAMLLAVAAVKAGLFPLYYWLPGSYPILSPAAGAFFAGMLTKVGVYVIIRLVTTVFTLDPVFYQVIAWIAGLTMITGVVGAVSRNTIRSILSFHIISQIGFMILAVGLFTPVAIATAIFYIIHHIIVKGTLFLTAGNVIALNGTDNLNETGGMWKFAPVASLAFLFQALSLAGIPPLSGFWGKFMIVVEGLAQGEYALITLSLIASVLTLFSMLKIWLGAYWKPTTNINPDASSGRLTAVVAVCTLISLAIGLFAGPVFELATHAATVAMDRPAYIDAVLSAGRPL